MRTDVVVVGALASAIAVWFAWGGLRWLRVASQGSSECGGFAVNPRDAYLRAAIRGVGAAAVLGCIVAYALGAHVMWAIVGPPFIIMGVYVAERQWYLFLRKRPA